MTLVLEDGTEVEALDGMEMLKALGERLDHTESQATTALGMAVALLQGQQATIGELAKSFATQTEAFNEQTELVKSLRADLDAVRNAPAGRKSVTVPVIPAGTMNKALDNDANEKGLPPQEFLAKCLDLQKVGKLSLQEVALAEAAIGSGVAVDPSIVAKVFQPK